MMTRFRYLAAVEAGGERNLHGNVMQVGKFVWW